MGRGRRRGRRAILLREESGSCLPHIVCVCVCVNYAFRKKKGIRAKLPNYS